LTKLNALEANIIRAMERPDISPNLRGEVVAYWKVLQLMLEVAGRRHTAGLDAYFRRQLAQRRETMLGIAADIDRELTAERTAGEHRLAAMYRKFHWGLGMSAVVILMIGATVAFATERRLVRLEGEARALSSQLFRAQEQERRAIARELHDDVGQALSGLMIDAGSASRLDSTAEIRPRLESIAGQAEHAMDAVRRIALALRPSMLDDLGLVAALEWQAREVSRRSGLSVRVDADESAGQLLDAQRTCIYRVAQEALENCARHSAAKQVRIGLERGAGRVVLRIEDDGKGFHTGRTRGVGLLGMEERVIELGGRFHVESEAGRGTTVTAELPA
jgi:signal transduction histidine kinase